MNGNWMRKISGLIIPDPVPDAPDICKIMCGTCSRPVLREGMPYTHIHLHSNGPDQPLVPLCDACYHKTLEPEGQVSSVLEYSIFAPHWRKPELQHNWRWDPKENIREKRWVLGQIMSESDPHSDLEIYNTTGIQDAEEVADRHFVCRIKAQYLAHPRHSYMKAVADAELHHFSGLMSYLTSIAETIDQAIADYESGRKKPEIQ